jgi:hypothetical protein
MVGEEENDRRDRGCSEREREELREFFPGWSAGPLAPGRPSWAGFSFFLYSAFFSYFLFSALLFEKVKPI